MLHIEVLVLIDWFSLVFIDLVLIDAGGDDLKQMAGTNIFKDKN